MGTSDASSLPCNVEKSDPTKLVSIKMFIECTTSDGLFTEECGVAVQSRSGTVELFVDKRLIHSSGGSTFLETKKSSDNGAWTRVVLPQEPFAGSSIIEVARAQVRERL
jgi:hypothetical protein